MAVLLQNVHDVELVFGEDLCESVGLLDGGSLRGGLFMFFVAEDACVENVGAHTQLLGGLLGDGERVAGHHLDLHAHRFRGSDGFLGIVPWRIEQGHTP